MEAIAPSEAAVAVLREIARAGFDYAQTKTMCEAAGWELEDDEPDLGYVSYFMRLTPSSEEQRRLSVQIANPYGVTPSAFVPLFFFDDFDQSRAPFDTAFRSLADQFVAIQGEASRVGEYSYPGRAKWAYSFAGWQLPEATLLLVQDYFDGQFGMDVTLWVMPAGSPVEVPVSAK
jgi:hypothetical protein